LYIIGINIFEAQHSIDILQSILRHFWYDKYINCIMARRTLMFVNQKIDGN